MSLKPRHVGEKIFSSPLSSGMLLLPAWKDLLEACPICLEIFPRQEGIDESDLLCALRPAPKLNPEDTEEKRVLSKATMAQQNPSFFLLEVSYACVWQRGAPGTRLRQNPSTVSWIWAMSLTKFDIVWTAVYPYQLWSVFGPGHSREGQYGLTKLPFKHSRSLFV